MKQQWTRFAEWTCDWWTLRAQCQALRERVLRAEQARGIAEAALARERARAARPSDEGACLPSLSAAEIERLAVLAEECGEAVQAVGKVLRHGYQSSSPFGRAPNRLGLEREMGDVRAAIERMIAAGDVRGSSVYYYRCRKLDNGGKWMHHQ
jgi:NTP pyrophosphatase (non-canonical NTP hydrolase)